MKTRTYLLCSTKPANTALSGEKNLIKPLAPSACATLLLDHRSIRRRITLCWVRLIAFLFLTSYFAQLPAAGEAPGIDSVTIVGTNVLISTTGAPGDLQFLARNYFLPETNFTYYLPHAVATNLTIQDFNHVFRNSISNAEDAVAISTVDTNGLAHFTVPIGAGVSYFQAKTVVNPTSVDDGTNFIRVIAFPEDLILTNYARPATFTALVEGPGPLQYHWSKNGVDIPGATNLTYSFPATNVDNGSTYLCRINILGDTNSVTLGSAKFGSPGALLTVLTNPPLTSVILGDGTNAIKVLAFPRDTIVTNTGTTNFTVIAEGTVTNLLQYRWYWNDLPIGATNPTATTATLTITNARYDSGPTSHTSLSSNTDVGFYSCDVNMVGHPPVRVRSADTNALGARLSVYTGTNTTLYTAYQTSGSTTCIGGYSGIVKFMSSANDYRFWAPAGTAYAKIKDLTNYSPLETNTVWFGNACQDSCHPALPRPSPSWSWSLSCETLYPYYFNIYVLTSPFPNGAQFTLDVQWSPNPIP